MEFELPLYSASLPAPDYSVDPIGGERTLQHTPRSSRLMAASSYIKHSGKNTVILHNQEEDVKIPRYSYGASITGTILFESGDNISKVVLQIYGKVETMSSEEGATTTVVLNNKTLLWSDVKEAGVCPNQIEFYARLPHNFNDNGRDWPLPPTYAVGFHGIPGLFIRTAYYMQCTVVRKPTRKIGFLTSTKRIFIPFEYQPRTRPNRPIATLPCFFSSVKTSPEEWYQSSAPLTAPQCAELDTIYSHLLVPSSRIYGIRDTIPFHVQLGGSEQALRAFLQPNSKESSKRRRDKSTDHKTSDFLSFFPALTQRAPSSSPVPALPESPPPYTMELTNTSSRNLPSPSLSPTVSPIPTSRHLSELPSLLSLDDENRPSLRVFLVRQVALEINGGKRSWRNQILGEAKLVNVPPPLSTSRHSPYDVAEPHQQEDHLDWEGELQVNEKFTVGGWHAAGVHVKGNLVPKDPSEMYLPLASSTRNARNSDTKGTPRAEKPMLLPASSGLDGVSQISPSKLPYLPKS